MRGIRELVLVVLAVVGLAACATRPARTPTPVTMREPSRAADKTNGPPLTSGSIRLLRSLHAVLRIDAYVTTGFPELDEFVKDMTELLDDYRREGRGKVEVRVVEAKTELIREQARQNQLNEEAMVGLSGGHPAARGFLGLVFQYGSEKSVIPWLPHEESQGLEFWISSKIRETRDKAHGIQHRIGVVAGKNELRLADALLTPREPGSPAPTVKGIIEQAFPFYRLEDVRLEGGTAVIDPHLAGLIITQPQQDYSELELRRIDEFLMRGDKALVVYASAVNLGSGETPRTASLSTRGLELLLDGYGIHMNRDAVFDYGSPFRVEFFAHDNRPRLLRHPGIARVVNDSSKLETRLDRGFAAFFRLDELLLPFPSSLELWRHRQPSGVKLSVVARTTLEANVERTEKVDMSFRDRWTATEPFRSHALAAYAQGKLKSAFAERSVATPKVPAQAPRSSRVLVVSSSAFLSNPFADADPAAGTSLSARNNETSVAARAFSKHLTSTLISFKSTLDWMTYDDDLLAASAKLTSGGPR